ncbi:hypothetical protein GCM10009116_21520 [Brevundimonas basaltis]|uniref:Uncharacterized protein n=1 Tax=Brevundimonas basaltis TaxID=472166 RepID=A0A7W8MHD8_9CAUL|nr:hypothetical protein [Brevundimonas basaltis]MBB5291901.1 hypothetical protein [Brevundimonas basaltis]
MTAATARPQTAMKRLAGALAFVCMVLFLLAIEQRHAVAAWDTVRTGAGPAARSVADWAARGFEDLRSTVARQTAAWTESRAVGSDGVGTGEPAGEATRPTAGGTMTMVGAELRFGNGEVLHTRPLRIAWGRDAFAPGQTFAARLAVPADAQIELREVVAPTPALPATPSSLCGDQPARAAAVVQRRDRVDLMLFRTRTIGPATPAGSLCGVWSFPVR